MQSSVRFSEVEYEALRTYYRAYGVRNISEFARLTLRRIVNESAGPQDSAAAKLEERVRRLELQTSVPVERLATGERSTLYPFAV